MTIGHRYRSIDVSTWSDGWFQGLGSPPPNGQFIWLFLLTGPFSTNIPGVLLTNAEMVRAYFGWPNSKGFREAWKGATSKVVAADTRTPLLWLPNALKPERRGNRPQSPNVVTAWGQTWTIVPECELKSDIWFALKAFVGGLGDGKREGSHEAFLKAFLKACPEPSVKPSAEAYGKPFLTRARVQEPQPQPEPEQEENPPYPPSAATRDVTQVVIEAFNRSFSGELEPSPFEDLIEPLLSKYTTDQLLCVVWWASMQWADDAEWSMRIQPGRLFRLNGKDPFHQNLALAKELWRKMNPGGREFRWPLQGNGYDEHETEAHGTVRPQ